VSAVGPALGTAEPPSLRRRARLLWGELPAEWLRRLAPLLMLVGLSVVVGVLNPRFFSWANASNIAEASAVPTIVGMALTLVVLTGSIDLSIEGNMGLVAVVVALLVRNQRNDNDFGWLAIVLALLLGLVIGLLNGVLHARLRIPSFMATLGVWFSLLGVAYLLYGGNPVPIKDLGLRQVAMGRIGGVPVIVLVALAVLGLCYFIQRWTKLGRYAYAIGGGESLAATAGVPVTRYKILIFAFAGVLIALAGVLNGFRLGAGSATVGRGMLFQSASAVVVGGTAITGGVGGMLNTLVGVLFITVLNNAVILLNINPFVELAVQGAVIVVAVAATLDRSKIRVLK
jgi:ribose transport system permease protein